MIAHLIDALLGLTLCSFLVAAFKGYLVKSEMESALDWQQPDILKIAPFERIKRDVYQEYKRSYPDSELVKRYRKYVLLSSIALIALAAEALLRPT